MNVDTFESNPSMKYYFITVVPFMLAVMVGWYALKHVLRFKAQVLPKKGIYESFYNEMAHANPTLWSRHGPRDYITPKGRISRLKWRLIRRWAAPEKTIKPELEKKNDVDPANDLGTLNRFRRYLMRRWTEQLERAARSNVTLSLEDGDVVDDADGKSETARSVIAEGLAEATEVMVIPATPAAEPIFDHDAPPQGPPGPPPLTPGTEGYFARVARPVDILSRKLSFQSRWEGGQLHRRSSSGGGTSGVVVEEEDCGYVSSQNQSQGVEKEKEGETKRSETGEKEDGDGGGNEGGRGAQDTARDDMPTTPTR